MQRGGFQLCMNFGDAPVLVPAAGAQLLLATRAGDATHEPGGVRLAPRAGAVLRG